MSCILWQLRQLFGFEQEQIYLIWARVRAFPGIPLAILFPDTQFMLIDGTRKKIGVVQEIVKALGLKNVATQQIRAEELRSKFDFVIVRAVARLDKLVNWSHWLIKNKQQHPLPKDFLP